MKKFLHVGCGLAHKEETTAEFAKDYWEEIRFDIDVNVEPDIVGTITDMSNVESGSMDAVFSAHNIEHIFAHEVPLALGEFYRVLKPDGYVLVTCPDLQAVAKVIAEDRLLEPLYESESGWISPIDIVFGHRQSILGGNIYMAHKCGFTTRVLAETLRHAGFKGVYGGSRPFPYLDLWMIAFKEEHEQEFYASEFQKHFAPRETKTASV